MSLLLKNCKILENNKLILTDIFIDKGKIKNICKNKNHKNDNKADKVIDVKGKIVLPGLIDPHVHFREPGLTHKEDFHTGSMAAAAGGVTTILDMPNTNPPTISVKLLDEKRKLAEKSIVNYGFYFGAAVDNIEEIKKTGESENIAGVKVFMNISTGKMMIDDKEKLQDTFNNSKLIAVHAEGEKVEEAIKLSKKNKLYLCHISTKDEIDAIKKYKQKPEYKNRIFVEVTPHHLFLTVKDDNDCFTKMKPELKSPLDQKALFDAIIEGIADTIGSDHAPHTIEEKKSFNFPHGVPGVETTLPLLLNEINRGRLTLKEIRKLCCENPAGIFKIKNKGFLKEGYDADIVIIDMNLEKEIKNEELFTKCKWSPFDGKTLKGWPVMTIVNGNIVFEEGRINNIKAKEVEFK